jgi:hypothetical protein
MRSIQARKISCFVPGHDFSRAVHTAIDEGFSPCVIAFPLHNFPPTLSFTPPLTLRDGVVQHLAILRRLQRFTATRQPAGFVAKGRNVTCQRSRRTNCIKVLWFVLVSRLMQNSIGEHKAKVIHKFPRRNQAQTGVSFNISSGCASEIHEALGKRSTCPLARAQRHKTVLST